MDPEDNKNIVVAMSLHEKGVKVLEKGEFDLAYTYLSEADSAFLKLKDQVLLDRIDNYARLCLDINWCLLKSDKIEELIANKWRLDRAHLILKKAYGENNERLIQLRGGCCPELVIYIRLFLLQAIICYNIKDIHRSQQFLLIAEEKLVQMTISENDMLALMQMGFTLREARVGLRACNKRTNDAAQSLLNRRDMDEKKKLEREAKKKLRRYGKTVSGKKIDTELLTVIVSQGFVDEQLAAEALKQTDNNLDRAIHLLTTDIELLKMAVAKTKPPYVPTEEDIQKLISFGFTPSLASGTLKLTQGNFEVALDKLLSGQGQEDIITPVQPIIPSVGTASSDTQNSEKSGDNMVVETEEERDKREKEKKLADEAEYELIEDHESDPLKAYDVDLTDETQFISHFRSLIESI